MLLSCDLSLEIYVIICLIVSRANSYTQEKKFTGKDPTDGKCKIGTQQSPINIIFNETISRVKQPLQFTDADRDMEILIENDGETLIGSDLGTTRVLISGGPLTTTYRFHNFELRWPSEHAFEYEQFPLEIHLVFMQTKYGSIRKAFGQDQGIAVLSALFEILTNKDGVLAVISDRWSQLNSKGENISVRMKLETMIPYDKDYFSYHGSKTKFGCPEGVVWLVFQKTLPISLTEFNKITNICLDGKNKIGFNNRVIQKVNGRKVSYCTSSCGQHLSSIIIISLICVFFI